MSSMNNANFWQILIMRSEKVTFKNAEGEELVAWIELPGDQRPHNFALFAHCFTCSKSLQAMRNISRALTLQGIAVMRFDFTGLGESEGEFADSNFSGNVQDVICAGEYLRDHYQAPGILVGHSLGGAAVILAAHALDSVKAVVTIGAPSHPNHVTRLLEDSLSEIREKGVGRVNIGGRPFTIKKQFLDDLEATQFDQKVRSLKKAMLIMHAPFDKIVGIENAAHLYELSMHPKSFISLDDADHLLTAAEHSLYAGDVMAVWAKRYLDMPQEEPLRSDKNIVCRLGPEGYTTEVKAGNHGFLADEPVSLGGDDLGPSPYDLLASGLGACTAITLRMYAKRKGWEVTNIKVHLQHEKIHAEDCLQCESTSGKIDKIERVIELEGDLTQEQRDRMLQIANKCPVHRTLHNEVVVDSKLMEQ